MFHWISFKIITYIHNLYSILSSLAPLMQIFRSKRKAIRTRHIFNSIEFDGIKIRIVEKLPQTNKFNCTPISHPVLQNIIAPLCVSLYLAISVRDTKSLRSTVFLLGFTLPSLANSIYLPIIQIPIFKIFNPFV